MFLAALLVIKMPGWPYSIWTAAVLHCSSTNYILLNYSAVIANRIIKTLRVPMRVGGDDIYVTASIGIATNSA